MSIDLSIGRSIYLSISLSNDRSIYQCTYPYIYILSIYRPIKRSIYRTIYLLFHLSRDRVISIYQSKCLSIVSLLRFALLLLSLLSFDRSIDRSIDISISLSKYRSIDLYIYILSNYRSIYRYI